MQRIAFRLQIKPDRIQDYDTAHQQVWPELLQVLKAAGISQYSIFRRGTELFFYLHAEDFDHAWGLVEASPVNTRWQREMAPLFEPVASLESGERRPMMREVFYLE
jgi:L-rhamnose mutarotase